ncbi:MAG: ATP-binding cassette domain-containing protein [Acidiferrobacterales bacterium]
MDPVVEAQGLTKRFKDETVVRSIELRVSPGQCFGFLGPNGAGKTTTLRMILGQSPLTAGSLQVFGLPMPRRGSEVRKRVGVVPQTDNLDPDFTVVENLRIYGAYFDLPTAVREQRIQHLLEFVELVDRAHAKIPTLSGGMRRRLTIARALINDPELVVLDEPTTGLDPQVRHMIWARLGDLRESGKTLLLTTHYMEEAERLCDDLVIMDEGEILDQGPPRRLVANHVEREVIEIRGARGLANGLLDGLSHCRTETIGDTVYCYTEDGRAVVEKIEAVDNLVFLHRPGNLEDVFLKLTGHELKD